MDISQFKPAGLPKRLEQALLRANWDDRNVLVGCLRDRRQLNVCLRHGFYHMPVERMDGDGAAVRWVAIYQSQTLFGSRGGVRYYGKVTGWEIVPRREITQIPRDSDDLYYRFTVDRWRVLPRTVISKEIPFTHMVTTWFLLKHGTEVPELFLEDEGQFRLYRALKKLLSARRKRLSGFRFGDSAVVLKNGEICILQGGVLQPTYLQENFVETPHTVFAHIHKKITEKV